VGNSRESKLSFHVKPISSIVMNSGYNAEPKRVMDIIQIGFVDCSIIIGACVNET